jgi:hypothetical protein
VLQCALLVGAVLWTAPARGDEAADVTLNVGHARPGATVHVTVTPACDATAVHLSLTGRSAAKDESGTSGSEADATGSGSGSWATDLRVADDLAAPQDVDVDAEITCAGTSVLSMASAALGVDPLGTQRLSVTGAVAVGERAQYAMTGGHGSCWSAWVTDSDGAAWWLFTSGQPEGQELDGQVYPSSDQATHVSGSFEVPAGMALGTATLTVHCSQTVDRAARFDVLPASASTAAPREVTETGTPDPRRTGSRITLGGGLPIVTTAPEPLDPRFPLPTLAPPLEPAATAGPVFVAAVPAATHGTWLGWWALLGLLVVPVLVVPWGLRRRRRPLSSS